MTEAARPDSLAFVARVPATVRSGMPVPIRLVLTNVTSAPIEVHLQGRETVFDVVVLDDAGVEVWRRLAGVPSLAILQLRPLAAGDSLEFVASWDQSGPGGVRVGPGTYRIIGELPSDAPGVRRTAPATIAITATGTTAAPG